MLSIECVDEDVFRLIAVELSQGKDGSLTHLASTSHLLRDLAIPVLFSRCLVYYSGTLGTPPPVIRPFVRTITYRGIANPDNPESNAPELAYFPAVRYVIFGGEGGGVPWPIVQTCLAHPSITSLTFILLSPFRAFPEEEVIANTSVHLTHLSYKPDMWRGFIVGPLNVRASLMYGQLTPATWKKELEVESRSLSPIVLNMSDTAEFLDLPMETTPLALMAGQRWLRLRQFKLHGEVGTAAQASTLPSIILQMPQLVDLSIMVARSKDIGRLSVLGRSSSHDLKPFELRSLVLAYPDPNDVIFDLVGTSLTRLSLSDRPRYYLHLVSCVVASRWCAPILSATECLGLLKRMTMPYLEHLELVYQADKEEDDLLDYVAQSFPRLSNLELHRYRWNEGEIVPYIHIARVLASAKTLRTVYFNLDFHDDHGPFCENLDKLFSWEVILDRRGWEIEALFRSCPALQFVALLCHERDEVMWKEYHSKRHAESRMMVRSSDIPFFPMPFRR